MKVEVKTQDLREALGLTREWCAERLGVTERVIQYREQTEKDHFRMFLFKTYADICEGRHKHIPPAALTREASRRALIEHYMNEKK